MRFRPRFLRIVSALLIVSLATIGAAQPASAAKSCAVEDPEHDTLGDSTLEDAFPYQAHLDLVSVGITKKGPTFAFLMALAGPVPDAPILFPHEKQIWWEWSLDTEAASPTGFPFPPSFTRPVDFILAVEWDGTAFRAFLIDRTPLLTGQTATVTPVGFNIEGAEVRVSLAATMIDDPSSFLWQGLVRTWVADLEGFSWFFHDLTVPGIPWPC